MALPFATTKTKWPHYAFADASRPQAVRESHCFPLEAEQVGKKILPVGWRRDDLPSPVMRRAVEQPMIYDQNVSITLRDGVKLRADIFRSVETDPAVPGQEEGRKQRVPTVLMYGPYGKTGTGPQQVSLRTVRCGCHIRCPCRELIQALPCPPPSSSSKG
jgi:predicted acyl esterase